MHRFDYSFLRESVPGSVIGVVDIISDLNAKEAFRQQQYKTTFEKLRETAIIESVKGSNAIEGIVTTDGRIRDIVAGAAPISHQEQEISGYKDALQAIHEGHQYMDVTEETILYFHKSIEQMSNPYEAGTYKRRDNLIMEYHSDGSRRVRFKPVSAADTPVAVEQMLLAYYDARQDSDIPAILLIPCVVLDFLCIHPFLDGNGRVSRLLSVLMLYIAGYDICKYISFEGQINEYKDSYYRELQKSSEGWHENVNDYMPFVINFLQLLYRCFKNLDDSFTEISLKKAKKSERVEAVLLSAIVPISKADVMHRLPDVSIKTVELVISKLIKAGRIDKIGTYRDARYVRH